MRPDQIKFRGKSVTTEDWVYGDLLHIAGGSIIYHGSHTEHYTIDRDDVAIELLHGEVSVVDPYTIGQFTGLKTKDGHEIYEGDILTIKEYDNLGILAFSGDELKVFSLQDLMGNLRKEWKGEVEYGNASFYIGDMWLDGLFGDMRCSSPIYEFELIGNIFDNKDLLEG